MSDVFGQCVRCGGNLTTGHRCPMSETYEVPRVPFDVRDLIQNLGNMKAESADRIAALESQLRERDAEIALLNAKVQYFGDANAKHLAKFDQAEAALRKAVGLLAELPTQTTNEQRQWEMRRDAFLASPEVAKLKGGE